MTFGPPLKSKHTEKEWTHEIFHYTNPIHIEMINITKLIQSLPFKFYGAEYAE